MKTNKLFLLVAATFLTGAFGAVSAMADVARPLPYQHLTAVTMAPEQAPRLNRGFSDLGDVEGRYQERLPVQLGGPVGKISKASYHKKTKSLKPKIKTKKRAAKTIHF